MYARDAANQGDTWLPMSVAEPQRSRDLEELTAKIEEIRAIAAGSETSEGIRTLHRRPFI